MQKLLSLFICVLLCFPAMAEEKKTSEEILIQNKKRNAEPSEKAKEEFKDVENSAKSGRNKKSEVREVRSFNIKNAMDGNVQMFFIDVRDQKSFYKGRIKGAINLHPEEIEKRSLRKIFPNSRVFIIVYGQERDDERAIKASEDIKNMGYENVFFFRNGFDEWEMREYAIDKK